MAINKPGRYNSTMILYRIMDTLVIVFSWEAAYFLRFHVMKSGQQNLDPTIALMAILVVVITHLFFSHNDLYTSQRYFSWYREMFSIFKSQFQSISTVIVLLYFLNPSRLSRIMLMIYTVIVVLLSLSERLIIKAVLQRLRRRGRNLKHVVLIGHSESIYEYALKIINTPELGLRISGWFDSRGKADKIGIKVIDSIADIPVIRKEGSPDALIVGYKSRDYSLQSHSLAHFNKTIVPVWILQDIEHTFIGYTIESFHGLPMIKINGNRLSMVENLSKRSIDIIGSLAALILFSPFLLIFSIGVKITSRGPIFYGQERMSLNGHSFTMWKFRSMHSDAEDKSGAVWTTKNDSRTTGFGSFLRKTSMDELPQFWNILKGDMSLVGPRPERSVFIEQFKDDIPSYMLRHKMKSGLTGWAQVNGWRGDTSLEKRIEFDLYYIQNWTIWMDIKILFLTILRGFVNPNAY